jgi:hypothetical protein
MFDLEKVELDVTILIISSETLLHILITDLLFVRPSFCICFADLFLGFGELVDCPLLSNKQFFELIPTSYLNFHKDIYVDFSLSYLHIDHITYHI